MRFSRSSLNLGITISRVGSAVSPTGAVLRSFVFVTVCLSYGSGHADDRLTRSGLRYETNDLDASRTPTWPYDLVALVPG